MRNTAKVYELVVRVVDFDNTSNLTTVIEVLKNAAEIVSMKQVDAAPSGPENRKTDRKTPSMGSSFYVGGKRDKGIKGVDLMKQLLADGAAHTREELAAAFMARGFNGDSISPVLSEMGKDGTAVRVGSGIWQKATPKS